MSAVTDALETPRRAAVIFILITVVMDALGFGLILPVLPKLVQQLAGGDMAKGAITHGLFATVWSLMQFLFSPLLGAISDRFGRRPVILISCFGLGLDYIVMASSPNLGWLLFGRVISGIVCSSFTTTSAYVADVVPPEKRAAVYGMIGAAYGVGFVLGPALGGVLGDMSPRLPFWGAAILALASTVYGLMVLPESLPPSKRDLFSWKNANPVGSLILLRSNADLSTLAGVNLLFQLAYCVLPSTFVLYTSYRYGWSATKVGLTFMAGGVLSIIVQGGLVNLAVRHLGERGSMYAGLLFGAVSFAGFGLAPTSLWMWALLPVFSLMGLFAPGLQSLMSRRVAVHEQGKLQGANGSLTSIAGLIGPGVFASSFARFIEPSRTWVLPGAPYFIAAGLLLFALLVAMRVGRSDPTRVVESAY